MATPTVFESARHGYRLEVPTNWNVLEYEGTWTELSQFHPGEEVVGEDVVAPPNLAIFLVLNSMAIPAEMTEDEWLTAFDAAVAAGLSPDCSGTATDGEVAGVAATVLTQECEGDLIVGRSLTHAGRGYYFTTRAPADSEPSIALLEDVVGSIEFTE